MKHLDTAERLHFFLAQQKLSRERFLQDIQNAITRSSLLSLLNGHRRPARTFALLLEWKWGFRAEYLLSGKGEAWTSAGTGKSGLSPLEQDVVGFMRAAPSNAHEIQGALERATLWNRLYARMDVALERLATLDPADRQYPALVTLTLEDCWRLADIHKRVGALVQARRVLRLTQRFMQRFVLPQAVGSKGMQEIMISLEGRVRAVDLAMRHLHDALAHQEGACLSIDVILDSQADDRLDATADIIRDIEAHRHALEAQGLPVDAFVARLRARRSAADVDAWSALLMSRVKALESTEAEEGALAGPGDTVLEFRRLLAVIGG